MSGGIKVLTVCVPGLIVFNQAAAAGPRSGGVQTEGGLWSVGGVTSQLSAADTE